MGWPERGVYFLFEPGESRANDGTPRVWFSLLTPLDTGLRIGHCALDYDHAAPAVKMRRAGSGFYQVVYFV